MLDDAKTICLDAISKCLPDKAVLKALDDFKAQGDIYLVATGKAAYAMAKAAIKKVKIKKGIVISKYGHIESKLDDITCFEAGHPIVDENSIKATDEVINMCKDLKKDDTVLFLLSGGASALFEKPVIDLSKLQDINNQMLKKGLSINEINTIRKRLSLTKAGRFADICYPAKVYSIILSDVLDDDLSTIGSGPTVKDESSVDHALSIIEKYDLKLDEDTIIRLKTNKGGKAINAANKIIGSVRLLSEYAMDSARKMGYEPILVSDHIDIEASKAGDLIFEEMKKLPRGKYALIMAGECVVKVKGNGLGGRNQELVLSQTEHLKDLEDVVLISLGSDGTDGPTDAAGGYIDGSSYGAFEKLGVDYKKYLENNDSYHALKMTDSLIFTGPTNTNVNDITILLKIS